MAIDPDEIIASWITWFVPLWGPFYAMFYVLRLLWREMFRK